MHLINKVQHYIIMFEQVTISEAFNIILCLMRNETVVKYPYLAVSLPYP